MLLSDKDNGSKSNMVQFPITTRLVVSSCVLVVSSRHIRMSTDGTEAVAQPGWHRYRHVVQLWIIRISACQRCTMHG